MARHTIKEMPVDYRPTRRTLFEHSALAGAGLMLAPGLARAARMAAPSVRLTWLDGTPPLPTGAAWGVPWPRGAVRRSDRIVVQGGDAAIPAQAWPMAYWPDGSVKWTGLAVAATKDMGDLTVSVGNRNGPRPAKPLTVEQNAQAVVVRTGALTATIDRSGDALVRSLVVDGREVARDGRLVVLREDRSRETAEGMVREERFTSRVTRVTVEQDGPVRAVVHIGGTHTGSGAGARSWLPFSVRLYFTAGLGSVRMVHSFVFDGNQKADFIKGLGLRFAVPFREETHNRHVRFATDGDHVFAEPVVLIPGYRPSAMKDAAANERAQLLGQRLPALAQFTDKERANLASTAVWEDFNLSQLSADGWDMHKRTNAASAWLQVTGGQRAGGVAFLGDVSGGLAIGQRDFWQKYPAAFEILGAARDAGTLTAWLWSPDATPMDLRHYDTKGHGLSVTYEDYEEGHADAYGCANTAELMLWATPDTPSPETIDAMRRVTHNPPLPICAPEHYHATETLGYWSLPGTPTPGLTPAEIASADTQLDRAFAFYAGEVERRRWYGFWDYGDYRRTYDPIRRQWMYDIGGHGWNATELMPNVWLWFAFLRSGRADIFRAAEAMTRNNNEVDVHHIGPFAGLGSRHNVSHWGDAKEARVNEAFIKRFFYYLTTDDRTGDLLREPLATVEASIARNPPLRKIAPRPDVPAPQAFLRVGPDWLALASNWLVEWERTGDTRYRDYCLTGMRDIGAMGDTFLKDDAFAFDPVTKHLRSVGAPNQKPSQFLFLFAGDQIAVELQALIPCPPFTQAWGRLCEQFTQGKRANWYFEPRVTAYAANFTGSAELEAKSLELYRALLKFGDSDYFRAPPVRYTGPATVQETVENPGTSTFTPALATPEVSQWAINLITMPVLLRKFAAGRSG
jgi:hypothetical protein